MRYQWCRERKHIGSVIPVEKLPVEPPQLGITGDPHTETLTAGDLLPEHSRELFDRFAPESQSRWYTAKLHQIIFR